MIDAFVSMWNVQLLFQEANPGVKYEYTIKRSRPLGNEILEPEYIWKYGAWTDCSTTCGLGTEQDFSLLNPQDSLVCLCWSSLFQQGFDSMWSVVSVQVSSISLCVVLSQRLVWWRNRCVTPAHVLMTGIASVRTWTALQGTLLYK